MSTKAIWNDTTSHSRGESPEARKVQREATLDLGVMTVSVHRHIHYDPADWLVLTRPEILHGVVAHGCSIEEAQRAALAKLQEVLSKALRAVEKARCEG